MLYEVITQNVFFISVYNKPDGEVANSTKINFLPSLISKYELNDKEQNDRSYTLAAFIEYNLSKHEDTNQHILRNNFV